MHSDLPLWVAILVAFFLVSGALLTFIGSLGLLRLKSFYDRLHAPTLGTTIGTACVLLASFTLFTALDSRTALHEVLIVVFVTVTTPITLMLLVRAALHRDRVEGKTPVRDDTLR